LIVTFVSGKTYAYGLVPKHVYDDFRGPERRAISSTAKSATATRPADKIGPKP
jgi:hypothetical protein